MPSSVAESTLGPLELEEIRPGALTASDLTRWRGFLAANPDLRSPFFAPEFTRIAGEIAPHARVAVLHRRGEVAGFLPFQRRGATLQPLAAPLNDYQGVIAPPRGGPELDALLRLLGVGGAWVTGWIGPAGSATGLCPASAALADLSAGWDDYLARQSAAHPKFFRDKGRVRRRIETAFKRCAVTDDDQDEVGLGELVKLKRRQLHRTGQHDIFRCGWTQDILAALLAQPRSGLHARIATLRLDDHVAGYELSLAAGAMQHFWIPAYDPEFAAHSPGMLLSLDTMQARRAQGVTLFDLGSGPERYKTYFANAARPVLTGFAYRPEGIAAPLMAGDRVGKLRRRWAVIEACGDYASGLSRGAGAMLRLSRARVRGAVDDHHRS